MSNPILVANVEFADVMTDANSDLVGLRFDDDHIFSMPAAVAAQLGIGLLECTLRVCGLDQPQL
jgi:hypothetical protein